MAEARASWAFFVGVVATSAGCGDEQEAGCGADSVSTATTTGVSAPVPVEGSTCGAVVTQEAESPALHVAECSTVEYTTNPPSSGSHYGSWAAYREYDHAVPRGYWVHSLEHGAVVVVYNCDDCDDELERAREMIRELPEDPACVGSGVARRVILTPDPKLDVRWAAAAWTFTLRADCFEPEVFRAFAIDHYAMALENTCSPGREL